MKTTRAMTLAALFLGACETRTATCPGDVQGTLSFSGSADEPLTTCPWFRR